jgi:hypothetical protein
LPSARRPGAAPAKRLGKAGPARATKLKSALPAKGGARKTKGAPARKAKGAAR